MQTTFLSGTNVCDCHNMQINFWLGTKKFGPVQNILRPVKGQGKRNSEIFYEKKEY